jgi:hypothetical protein
MSMRAYVYVLHDIADRCGLKSVRALAREPGVKGVYRVTVNHSDRQTADVVATLRQESAPEVRLEVVYPGRFGNRPLVRYLDERPFEAFVRGLQRARFDRLSDQPGIPTHDVPLLMLERAAGSFSKDLVLMPSHAEDVYADLLAAIERAMPEALRKIPK